MVAEYNRYHVRGFSITSFYRDPRTRYSIGPIIDGMGWRQTVSLDELRLNFVDCTEYGKSIVFSEKDERPKVIDMGTLKLLQLHECDGNIELMDGIYEGSVNIETFVFPVNDGAIQAEEEEEEALVRLVRSAANLRTLSLAYIPPPPPPTPPAAQSPSGPEFAIFTDYPEESRNSRIHETQRRADDIFSQADFMQEHCRFPLARLLGPVNHRLRSLSLTQDLGSKMRIEDLAYIGRTCPYLTDLAIPFPDIAEAFPGAYLDKYIKLQLESLANVLSKSFPNLRYLQLIASGAHRDFFPGYVSPLERITRAAIQILSGHGLQLRFFTLALRNNEWPHTYGAEACHLRVRSDPKLSETIGEKALKRDMAVYGDCERCNFEGVVQKKTGFVYDRWVEEEDDNGA